MLLETVARDQAALRKRLVCFQIVRIDEIKAADAKRMGRRRLTKGFVGSLAIALQQHGAKRPNEPFRLFDFQPALPLSAANQS
jgi:hypothetical protein